MLFKLTNGWMDGWVDGWMMKKGLANKKAIETDGRQMRMQSQHVVVAIQGGVEVNLLCYLEKNRIDDRWDDG